MKMTLIWCHATGNFNKNTNPHTMMCHRPSEPIACWIGSDLYGSVCFWLSPLCVFSAAAFVPFASTSFAAINGHHTFRVTSKNYSISINECYWMQFVNSKQYLIDHSHQNYAIDQIDSDRNQWDKLCYFVNERTNLIPVDVIRWKLLLPELNLIFDTHSSSKRSNCCSCALDILILYIQRKSSNYSL